MFAHAWLWVVSTVLLLPGSVRGLAAEGTAGVLGVLVTLTSLPSVVKVRCEEAHRYLVSVVGENVVHTAAENCNLYLESLFGQERVQMVLECFQMVVGFLSEGVASGLNVIAVYVTEILRATGVTVELPFPRFTAEGIASVAQWAILAIIGYLLLSLVVRLLWFLLRRVMWLLKLSLVLWLFMRIVGDSSATTDTTALRLAFLVCGCVVLGLGSSREEGVGTTRLENRLKGLEGRVKEMEQRRDEQ